MLRVLLDCAPDNIVARLIALATTLSRGSALNNNVTRLKDSSCDKKSVQYCIERTSEMDSYFLIPA
jgi:hypothetical protein